MTVSFAKIVYNFCVLMRDSKPITLIGESHIEKTAVIKFGCHV